MAPSERTHARRTVLRAVAGIGAVGVSGLASADASLNVVTAGNYENAAWSINLNGNVKDLGGAASADVYFEYRVKGTSTWSTSSVKTVTSTGTFTIEVGGLTEDTTYEYRAVAEASDGFVDRGSINQFSTMEDTALEISTGTFAWPQNVTSTSAELGGWLDDTGGAEEVYGYAQYRKQGDTEWIDSDESVRLTYDDVISYNGGDFEVTVTGLDPGTTYEWRAAGDASDGEFDAGVVDTVTTT